MYVDELTHMYQVKTKFRTCGGIISSLIEFYNLQRLFHKTLNYQDYKFTDYDSFLRSLDQCEEIVFSNTHQRTILSLNEQSPNETIVADDEDESLVCNARNSDRR